MKYISHKNKEIHKKFTKTIKYIRIVRKLHLIKEYVKCLQLRTMGSRTTLHEDNSPPDKNKAFRTIAHQDHNP